MPCDFTNISDSSKQIKSYLLTCLSAKNSLNCHYLGWSKDFIYHCIKLLETKKGNMADGL